MNYPYNKIFSPGKAHFFSSFEKKHIYLFLIWQNGLQKPACNIDNELNGRV